MTSGHSLPQVNLSVQGGTHEFLTDFTPLNEFMTSFDNKEVDTGGVEERVFCRLPQHFAISNEYLDETQIGRTKQSLK
ncbi:hypothetical protein TNCV_3065601 [Trichonephila clavipes]|uniref:Uncharacterized protein n=1 Tax=Trichonephila clavipes TaxID=2585209 RepID=A0A8X6RMM5_TRICX|nr:hypothetical protein TNCV_3065601 [Trichonephila clavipes]